MNTRLDYLRTYGCEAAGCTDPAYAERDLHAPNCTQSEIDVALDEIARIEHAIREHIPACYLAMMDPGAREALRRVVDEGADYRE